ncbi:MAG: hypothetical protein IJE79_04265 [Alphaproteobacteria bacterium]|nr:hypothetical protein [Alphaproteobacteria bacterium]
MKKKYIYTGIFCTILGLCINTPANASIISRSFLDEALTDYATTTALDLKANQSDFTDLNTQIRDSVDILRQLLIQGGNSYKFVNNINPEKFPNTISGAFGLLYQYLDMFAGSILYGWTDENGTSYAGFDALNNGWTDSEKNTYLGVKGLNDKIGTLPEGITVQGMYEGWTDENNGVLANPGLKGIYEGWVGNNGLHTQGLQMLELDSFYTYNPENDSPQLLKGLKGGLLNVLSSLLNNYGYSAFDGELAPFWKLTQSAYKTDELSAKIGTLPTTLSALPPFIEIFGMDENINLPTDIGGILSLLFSTDGGKPTFYGLANAIMRGYLSSDGTSVPGLRGINDKIGTLPTGEVPQQKAWTEFLSSMNQNYDIEPVYPTSLAGLMELLFGIGGSVNNSGILPNMFLGIPVDMDHDGRLDNNETIGIYNNFLLAEQATNAIGTLPSGSLLGNSPAMDALFISTQGTNIPVFPNSLSDLINQLYGSTEGPGAISALLHGFDFTLGEYNGPVGVLPAMELSLSATQIANRAKALAESNATTIGTLPDGYETVGAALSAIKGIAEEAKAAALAAIPDPKTEGSNGKYVLTVDIIGDNATYRWEPIDRSKTTATTE